MSGFMTPQITDKGRHWCVETRAGTWFVPNDLLGVPDWIKADVKIPDAEIPRWIIQNLEDYVEPGADNWTGITVVEGYCGRLSAPGYLDCTDWVFSKNLLSLRAKLRE